MSNADLFGHIFYAFIFIGMLLLAKKNIMGWPLRFIGEMGWLGIGVHLGLTSVWMWGMVFVVMDVFGFLNWRKQNAG